MRTISEEEIKVVLENHRHWMNEDCDEWVKMRADFSNADLRGANLKGANLRGAELKGANLRGADLKGADLKGANLRGADLRDADLSYADFSNADFSNADLRGADLRGANLSGANLRGADLRGANLRGANLRDADLSGANLSGADLRGANLRDANLSGENLSGANLSGANLSGANLSGANLSGANLRDAKNMPYVPMICPEEGDFIGWKKAIADGSIADGYVIVKLLILKNAKRSNATSRKCRCDKAQVIEIYNLDGTIAEERKCHSNYCRDFIYEVGKIVEVKDFNKDRWNECAAGIHFFINRQEAVDYSF